ncbi:MAG: metallophosphoesterase [Candidatus Aenigmatarchaeota archaeon]
MFVKNYPAMKIGNNLIIADLHIGITKDIYEHGVKILNQTKSLAKKVNELKIMTNTKRLIILGDIKHKIPKITFQELKEVPEFLSLVDFKDIIIIKGNHDGNIEKIIKNINKNIKVKKSFIIGKYLLTHGHRNVKTNKIIIIGHNQPHIKFKDDIGAVYIEPVWIRGLTKDKKKLIIMPAFNELCGATIVNRDELLGPIAKKLIKKKSHVYLLDGTDLGTLNDLEITD